MKRFAFFVMLLLSASTMVYGQRSSKKNAVAVAPQKAADDIVLVVSGTGETKEAATKAALLSAIQQTYGTFVSSNTEILNDELIKDEIVTVSRGNVKYYKELSSITLPSGLQEVTLQAMISISTLSSYAKSKGSSAELAGAAFAMNMKIFEANKQNELAALQHLATQMTIMIPQLYTKILTIGEPHLINDIDYFELRDVLSIHYKSVDDSVAEMEMKKAEAQMPKASDVYAVPFSVSYHYNENSAGIVLYLMRTLEALSLTQKEAESYQKQGIEPTLCRFSVDKIFHCWVVEHGLGNGNLSMSMSKIIPLQVDNYGNVTQTVGFRNTVEDICEVLSPIFESLYLNKYDFALLDNLGQTSRFDLNQNILQGSGDFLSGTGLFSPYFKVMSGFDSMPKEWFKKWGPTQSNVDAFKFEILIPKAEIGKYSNFQLIEN